MTVWIQRPHGPTIRVLTAILLWAMGSFAIAAETKPNLIVILTDDLGYADMGSQRQESDVRTPHLDRLATEGVRCTAGYVTAPQCSPSRAGLITGRYQQRFGIDTIPDVPLPLAAVTIAERLKSAGYTSGHVGKWHLEPNALSRKWAETNLPAHAASTPGRLIIPESDRQRYMPAAQGFDDYFSGEMNRYYANYDLAGSDQAPSWVDDGRFRVEVQTDAALAFLRRNQARPFFLYLNYFAPHTPLVLPENYAAGFPTDLPQRRRAALAMMAAVDQGVGHILAALQRHGVDDNTLIIFTSDNGAPVHRRRDSPLDEDMGGWDGSLNTPWVGEKGMLSEGGIRVPFLVRWPAGIPGGKVYHQPVSTLDIAATAAALAGIARDDQLDGVDLTPFLSGRRQDAPHAELYWRFWSQAAVRAGRWKLLTKAGEPDRLFDLDSDYHEHRDLAQQLPEHVQALRAKLVGWTNTLEPRGLPAAGRNQQERAWYQEYFPRPTAAPR